MDTRELRIVFGCILFACLCWVAAPWVAGRSPGGPLAATGVELRFDASRAYEDAREFVTRFPKRVLGSLEARQSTGFLKDALEAAGYEIAYTHFDATIAGRRQVGRNVIAHRGMPSGDLIVVLAHYDTAETTVQGAMDNGAAVGVLLELARLFAEEPLRYGVLFLLTDGEEWGMLGARDFAQSSGYRDRVRAALSLDFVAVGDIAEIRLDATGQFSGYAPAWLRTLSRDSAAAEGLAVREPRGFAEHLERAFLLSWTDQGPLLDAGIPAINLNSSSADETLQWDVYHSARDAIDNIEPRSVERFGRVAERILRGLQAMPSLPPGDMGEYRLTARTFIPAWAATALHLLLFLPLLVAAVFQLRNNRRFLNWARTRRELIACLGTLAPMVLLYYAILLLGRLRIIPRYSLYPPPPRDPVLEAPSWAALLALFGTVAATAAVCFFLVRHLNRKAPMADFHVSKLVLLLLLLATAAGGLAHNTYWAATFLTLPAWLWVAIGAGEGYGARAANRILIAGAGIVYYSVLVLFAARLGLGWKMLWYQVLALGSGMFTLTGFLLGAFVVALGIRFLVIQSHSRGAGA